jgi:hypothetical protein
MSYDRKLDQVCQHVVVDETLYVSNDRQTIRPLRPIASANSVTVRLDGAITVPSQGTFLAAQSTGLRQGPYTIQAGVNDTLQVRVNAGLVQTVVLPASNRVSSAALAAHLTTAIRGLTFSSLSNRVAFQTDTTGPEASVFIESSSTLGKVLGIVVGREYRGKQTTPGWMLVNDPRTLADRPTRLIVFDTPLRSVSDFVEVSYSTIRQECRRCGGLGIENDWRYGTNGDVIEVRDEALLLQELQKVFYTLLGSNPFHTWYGTTLLEAVGKKISASGLVQSLVVSDINQAFSRWQSIKRQQEQAVGQLVTDSEFPFHLLSVNLQQSTRDPTIVFVKVSVQNRSRQAIQIERGIRLPMPLDILGSTAQQGAIRQSLSNFVLTG